MTWSVTDAFGRSMGRYTWDDAVRARDFLNTFGNHGPYSVRPWLNWRAA